MARKRRKEIILGGKHLWQLSIGQIIDFASRPGHTRYDLGAEQDYWRNRHLLEAFGERLVCTSIELVDAYHEQNRDDFSKEFDALRMGEMLGFALEHELVRQQADGWQLVHREQQFECVGPADKQRAIRVRNAPADKAEENAKLWARELKRREKARLKRLGRHKTSIQNWLTDILRTAADTPLEGPLECFALGSFQTIGAVHEMIVGSIDGMTLHEAAEIDAYLGQIWANRPADDFSKRRPRPTLVDDAVLGDLYL